MSSQPPIGDAYKGMSPLLTWAFDTAPTAPHHKDCDCRRCKLRKKKRRRNRT